MIVKEFLDVVGEELGYIYITLKENNRCIFFDTISKMPSEFLTYKVEKLWSRFGLVLDIIKG